jgi:hypothetical protein
MLLGCRTIIYKSHTDSIQYEIGSHHCEDCVAGCSSTHGICFQIFGACAVSYPIPLPSLVAGRSRELLLKNCFLDDGSGSMRRFSNVTRIDDDKLC